MSKYNERLVEIDVILSYLNEEELEKIPEDVRRYIKENKSTDYIWEYDENKSLADQDISRETMALLSYLNMRYLLNEQQRKVMEQIHKYNESKLEDTKKEKYKTEDLFSTSSEEDNQEQAIENDTTEIVVYKENIFKKIFSKIKSFFNLK